VRPIGLDLRNNTVSTHPTHFLRGVELIEEARTQHRVQSENWTRPLYSFGHPRHDGYYAEFWNDGMDYNYFIWLIERLPLGNTPQILPLAFFPNDRDLEAIDLDELFEAVGQIRRAKTWLVEPNHQWRTADSIFCYFHVEPGQQDIYGLQAYSYRNMRAYLNKDLLHHMPYVNLEN